jgi:hypothetical protein
MMARRDPAGIRLLTRRGNDGATRFPAAGVAYHFNVCCNSATVKDSFSFGRDNG